MSSKWFEKWDFTALKRLIVWHETNLKTQWLCQLWNLPKKGCMHSYNEHSRGTPICITRQLNQKLDNLHPLQGKLKSNSLLQRWTIFPREDQIGRQDICFTRMNVKLKPESIAKESQVSQLTYIFIGIRNCYKVCLRNFLVSTYKQTTKTHCI